MILTQLLHVITYDFIIKKLYVHRLRYIYDTYQLYYTYYGKMQYFLHSNSIHATSHILLPHLIESHFKFSCVSHIHQKQTSCALDQPTHMQLC